MASLGWQCLAALLATTVGLVGRCLFGVFTASFSHVQFVRFRSSDRLAVVGSSLIGWHKTAHLYTVDLTIVYDFTKQSSAYRLLSIRQSQLSQHFLRVVQASLYS